MAGAASRLAPRRRCTWSQPRARPRAARTARPAARGPHIRCDQTPARPVLPPTPAVLGLREVPNSTGTLSTALLDHSTLFGVQGGEGGDRRREETRSCGSQSLDKVACWTPGDGGGGGRGKTMPRLRRGRRRLQARRAGRLGAGKLPGGAHRSEALASASRSSDTARGIAGLQQPPPPPGGPSKSLDLGEGVALSGITSRAGERPGKP